jgi:fatty acid desaturase
MQRRNYSLLGPEGGRARERGLTNATWYRTPVERKRLKQLMQRSDGPAIRHTLLWLGLIVAFGIAGVLTWRSWWSIPIFFVYGTLWGSGGDARCHEAGHGTAFRTRWLNEVVFQIGCFMTMREPLVRRWDHTRHHTDTVIVGRDREIVEPRPPGKLHLLGIFFALPWVPLQVRALVSHAFTGRLAEDEQQIIPESEWPKVIGQSRVILPIHLATIALAIATRSWLPVLLSIGPSMYGAWFMAYVALTQHVGLAEDVTDFRLNTRTIYMNPVFRFLYWNMNYHLEHHMYPMVPFHALKALHEEIKADCPPAYHGTLDVYRTELIPTLRAQLRDPDAYTRRPLPVALGSPSGAFIPTI